MANKLQQNLSLAEELLGGSRPLRRSGPTSLNLGEELLGGSDKLTIQDYLDYFGDKSSMADDEVGRILSKEDWRNEQIRNMLSDEKMINLALGVTGGGGLKTIGKSIARGGKNIIDILREALGVGRKEMGDVLSGYKRGSQPSQFTGKVKPGQQELFEDYISGATERVSGKQALKLNPQEINTNPFKPKKTINPEVFNTLEEATGRAVKKNPTLQNLYDDVAKQMDEAAGVVEEGMGPTRYGMHADNLDDYITENPEDFLELVRRALGKKPSKKTAVDLMKELEKYNQ